MVTIVIYPQIFSSVKLALHIQMMWGYCDLSIGKEVIA